MAEELRAVYAAKEDCVTIFTTIVKQESLELKTEIKAEYEAKIHEYLNIASSKVVERTPGESLADCYRERGFGGI